MITVISGTNRKESDCATFAAKYADFLLQEGAEEVKLLSLADIPHDWFHIDMYEKHTQSSSIRAIQEEYILPVDRFVYVLPEYNGSFPGVLKLFLDACSIYEYKTSFKGKKAALVGIASGRAGNIRGMEHFTGILNHVGTIVMPNKLPISKTEDLLDEQRQIKDPATLKVMHHHAKEFLDFVSLPVSKW